MLNMEKNTIGTKLPRKLEQKMQIVGDYIRLHIAGFRANKKATENQRLHYSWF